MENENQPETMRADFEAWAKQFKYDLTRCDPSYVNEPYANECTDWSWLAWQDGARHRKEKQK